MSSLVTFNLPIVLLGLSVLYLLYGKLTRNPVAELPGPKPESFIFGNLREYFEGQAGEIDFEWQETYGDVVRYKGLLGEDRILVSDPKALQHIFQTAGYSFAKPEDRRELSQLLAGRGILLAEGKLRI
jgi:hypothetical protein